MIDITDLARRVDHLANGRAMYPQERKQLLEDLLVAAPVLLEIVDAALSLAKGTPAEQGLPPLEHPATWDVNGAGGDALAVALRKVTR